jgi:hypothetical protein
MMEYVMCLLRREASEDVERALLSSIAMTCHHPSRMMQPPSGLNQKLAVWGLILNLDDPTPSDPTNPRLKYAQNIARIINRESEDKVELLLRLWIDYLAYAANHVTEDRVDDVTHRELSSTSHLLPTAAVSFVAGEITRS